MFKILRRLKLTLSERKSSMGSLLKKGFHYLGVSYEMARTSRTSVSPEKQAQQNQVRLTIHLRGCKRALDKVKALSDYAVHPVLIQRYLIRWVTWWHHTWGLGPQTNLRNWVKEAKVNAASLSWVGSGLLFMTHSRAGLTN